MPIPLLNDEGLLPEGIYPCTLQEIQERLGQFQSSVRRCRLYEQLETYVREVKATKLVTTLHVDGSFVTGKPEPNDIDLILILPSIRDFSVELRPFEYNALSRRQVRKRHGFDVLVAVAGQPELENAVAFFSQVRGRDAVRKGLLPVTL